MFFRRKRERFRENLVTVLEVPRDLACRETIVTLTGNKHAVVENYRNLLKFTKEEIIINTYSGKLTILGQRLGNSLVHCRRDDDNRLHFPQDNI